MRFILKLYILSLISLVVSCSGKYDDLAVDSEDVQGYVNVCTIFESDNPDFLQYISTHRSEADSNEVHDYCEVVDVLNSHGFIDLEYFMHVHGKLAPVMDVIRRNPDVERFPGIGTADLSFLEEGEKQYRKFLDDNTLSNDDKEFYRAQMAQIETTKLDLFYKQEKNKLWVELVREQSASESDVVLGDMDIMQLTILEREVTWFH